MQFRKKPVVIEAFQFKGWTGAASYFPEWFPFDGNQFEAMGAHLFLPNHAELQPLASVACLIKTLEGTMRADINDWIIQGVRGEFYPCKPDIFEATYEPV